MKATIIKSTKGIQAVLEDSTVYLAEKKETLKAFKVRVSVEVEEKMLDSVTFKHDNLKKYSDEALSGRLSSAASAVEVDAITQELASRGVEVNTGKVEVDEVELPAEDTEEEAEDTEEEANRLNLAKAEIEEAEAAYTKACQEVKGQVEEVKANCSSELSTAKGVLSLAKLDSEDDVDAAESDYKSARRLVALNNTGGGAGKTEAELTLDIEAIATAKTAYTEAKKAAKTKVEEAKDKLGEAKAKVAAKVEEAKTFCAAKVEGARKELETARASFSQKVESFTSQAVVDAKEAEVELVEATKEVTTAKDLLAFARDKQKAARAKLLEAKKILRKSSVKSAAGSGMTLAEAEAEAEAGRVNRGKIIFYVPKGAEEPIKVKIKGVTTDRRSNLSYYRMAAVEASEGVAKDKLFHVRIPRLGIDLSEIEI